MSQIVFLSIFSLIFLYISIGQGVAFNSEYDEDNKFDCGLTLGWKPVFSNYYQEIAKDFKYEVVPRNEKNVTSPYGYLIEAINNSGNLFMGLMKRITVEANSQYSISFNVTFFTHEAEECIGIGESASEGVIKVGSNNCKPIVLETENSEYLFNNTLLGSRLDPTVNFKVIGSVASPELKCCESRRFASVTRMLPMGRHYMRANEHGHLWLLVGAQTGFEGQTSIYYSDISYALDEIL